MLELAPWRTLMTRRWPSGEKRGAMLHVVGEHADDLALLRLDIVKVNPRLVAGIGDVGDLLRCRVEARRQHQVLAVGELADVEPVLVHDGEALDALVLRPALLDEHDAGVEIAVLAGQRLVDRIRDHVAHAAPVLRRGDELEAQHLGLGKTSHRRNSALSRPSGCMMTWPVTRAWAWMVRQSPKEGC